MRVLFDQGVPVPLRTFLTGHLVRTAAEEGWDRLSNGDLLSATEGAGFNVLITTDKNMRYQQSVLGGTVAVVLLTKQQWPELQKHVLLIAAAIDAAVAGSYFEVGIP